MICSLNEIGTTLRKASAGAGCAPGLDAGIASAGVWLCRHGLDGIGAALAALAGTDDRTHASVVVALEPDGDRVAQADRRVESCGLSLLELIVAGDADCAVVSRPNSPLLMVGFAGVLAAETESTFTLASEADRVIVSGRAVSPTAERLLHSCERIEIRRDAASVAAPTTASFDRPGHGVEIDPRSWTAAQQLASLTYVPATDESRLRGAGAGLTDND